MATGPTDFLGQAFPETLRFMENTVLAFYQALFSTFPEGSFRFDINSLNGQTDTGEIKIEGRRTDNLKDVNTRPKIVVSRGPVSWQGRGQGGSGFVGSANLSPLSRSFTDILEGTVGVSCFSREELESDRIAQICFDSIRMFTQPLLRKTGITMIRSAQVGQRGVLKSDSRDDLFVTPVLIQMQITKNWNTDQTDPVKLREILIQFVTRP